MLRLATLLVGLLIQGPAPGLGLQEEAREEAEINTEERTVNVEDKNQVTGHVFSNDLRQQNSEESSTSKTTTSESPGSHEPKYVDCWSP